MKTLKIFFTSDMHGYFLPTDFRDKTEKKMGLSCMLSKMDRDENSLFIDGGDTTQGSPLTYFANSRNLPSPAIEAVNHAQYDYYTLGNHDFNYGYDKLLAYTKGNHAKCLCANVKDKTGKMPLFPFEIKVMPNGLKVGLIGITTSFIPVWERPENIENFEIEDAEESIRSYVEELRPQCDLMVGIYHGGFECDLETGRKLSDTKENVACALCERYPFDILLTGHQHIPLEGTMYHGTLLVQTPANALSFIRVEAECDDENHPVSLHSQLVKADGEPDKDILSLLSAVNEEAQKWLDAPVGHLDHPLIPRDHALMASEPCDIADFFNMVQLDATHADFSCTSLGNEVKGFNQSVTVRDVVSTYIYPNTLVVLEVTKEQLKEALERSASYLEKDENGALKVSDIFLRPKVEHYNYDFFAGFSYTFDLSKPVGQRVVRMEKDGQPLHAHQKYTLCMNNYRATGTGGYDVYKSCPRVKEGTEEVSELIIMYLEKHHDVTVPRSDFQVIG